MSKSAFGKLLQSHHTVAVITVKICPAVNPSFCCATQWFQIIKEFTKNIQPKQDLDKYLTMMFPDLTWLISKMQSELSKISLSSHFTYGTSVRKSADSAGEYPSEGTKRNQRLHTREFKK